MGYDPGLCVTCRHGHCIDTDRGTTYWRCRRSESDPRFPRYPALPVGACTGWDEGSDADDALDDDPEPILHPPRP
jgi:hypothetical protein